VLVRLARCSAYTRTLAQQHHATVILRSPNSTSSSTHVSQPVPHYLVCSPLNLAHMLSPSRIARIRAYMREHLDNGDATLDLLPPHNDLEWVHHPHGIRQEGIVVGKSAFSTVVAFLTGPGDADRKIRFATVSHDDSRKLWPFDELNIDNVRHCSLNSPFKYFNCSSPLEIRMFAYVVQWYHISSGRMCGEEIESCSLTFRNFCKTLNWAAGAKDRARHDAEYASTLGHPSFAHDLSSITRQTRDTLIPRTVAPMGPTSTSNPQGLTRVTLPVVVQNTTTALRQPYQETSSQFTQAEGPTGMKRADILLWIQGVSPIPIASPTITCLFTHGVICTNEG
jgi:hypothetical protein